MMHSNRVWCVTEVETAEELALKLTKETWCCCQAFRIMGHERYTWLNDSTSEDGAQEYGVCCQNPATGDMRQIESITFGWCTTQQGLEYILTTLNGDDDQNDFAHPVTVSIQNSVQHGRCDHCA